MFLEGEKEKSEPSGVPSTSLTHLPISSLHLAHPPQFLTHVGFNQNVTFILAPKKKSVIILFNIRVWINFPDWRNKRNGERGRIICFYNWVNVLFISGSRKYLCFIRSTQIYLLKSVQDLEVCFFLFFIILFNLQIYKFCQPRHR